MHYTDYVLSLLTFKMVCVNDLNVSVNASFLFCLTNDA